MAASPPERATSISLYALFLLGFLSVFWGLNWPVMKIG